MQCVIIEKYRGIQRYSISSLLLTFFLVFSSHTFAIDEIYTGIFSSAAIKGYDTVAYFTENKAVKGSKKYTYQWKSTQWRFSSQENLALFKSDPEKYAPQYGGYCAYAVSQNTTASIEPDLFTIVDGKLYLNYNKKINDKWLGNKENYIVDADKYWPGILNK